MEKLNEERNYLERLRDLRDSYSDEIPKEIVSSISPEKRFKVRKVWWQLITLNLRQALKKGQIPNPEIQEEVEGFLEHYTSE